MEEEENKRQGVKINVIEVELDEETEEKMRQLFIQHQKEMAKIRKRMKRVKYMLLGLLVYMILTIVALFVAAIYPDNYWVQAGFDFMLYMGAIFGLVCAAYVTEQGFKTKSKKMVSIGLLLISVNGINILSQLAQM